MNIYPKLLAATLPVVFVFIVTAMGTTYYFAYQALTTLADRWIETRLVEAMAATSEQEAILHTYGLAEIPASIAKAQMDAGASMAAIEVGAEGYIFAVDIRGVLAAHPETTTVGGYVSKAEWFRQLKREGGRFRYQVAGQNHLAMYDYFAPWGWYVIVTAPEREVYGAIDRMRPYIVYLGLAGTAVLAYILMLLTRRLTEPLRLLTEGARHIGQGDLTTRIPVQSGDEFGQLANVFNRMTTNLKETLGTLQKKEENFRALIENSSDIVTILDGRGALLYHSPSAERLLGYTSAYLAGKTVFDLVHPDDADFLRQRFENRLRGESPLGFMEIRIRHQDGGWRTLEAIGQNLMDHPAVNGIVVNARDITQRKSAEAELQEAYQVLEQRVLDRTRELRRTNQRLEQEIDDRQKAVERMRASEQKMRAILHASPVGIGRVVDRKLDWANDALYRIVGYSQENLIGRDSAFLYPDRAEYERVGHKLYDERPSSEGGFVETRVVRGDGTTIDCALRSYPLDVEDPSKGRIVALLDTSQAKQLEAELQRARKMEALGTLAGGVAHDLNNILSGIVSYPELILIDLPDDSSLKAPIRTIKASGERAAAIVQDLLTMARRGVAVTGVVNLNTIVRDQLQRPEFARLKDCHPGVQVVVDLADDLLDIQGSEVHLAKTVLNLAFNAAEAMPEGGRLMVSTGNVYIDRPISGYEHVDEGDYACLTVSDNGTGLSAADQERIFEPFYTRKKMGRSGSGLGLAVVWGTVKDHNGYIDIQSKEGQGASFRLYFPATRAREAPKVQLPALEDLHGAGEKILVVDDAEVQRQIASRILEKLGYTVATAPSGEAALEYVKTTPVDLLILDMIMDPGMDGLDTYRRISDINPGQKAIIASGFSETERVREAQALGAGQYVRKPYTIEKIGLAVKAALKG